MSLEAKYHKDCYRDFLNSYRSHKRRVANEETDPYRLTYGCVVGELVQYMQEMFLYGSTAPVFKLSELAKLVETRLTDLGATSSKYLHRTRLKEDLMSLIPGLS